MYPICLLFTFCDRHGWRTKLIVSLDLDLGQSLRLSLGLGLGQSLRLSLGLLASFGNRGDRKKWKVGKCKGRHHKNECMYLLYPKNRELTANLSNVGRASGTTHIYIVSHFVDFYWLFVHYMVTCRGSRIATHDHAILNGRSKNTQIKHIYLNRLPTLYKAATIVVPVLTILGDSNPSCSHKAILRKHAENSKGWSFTNSVLIKFSTESISISSRFKIYRLFRVVLFF